ncbi:MAG: ABC transporter ATP-binding protein [Clostridiales bacterium]|nr:ABC transporter ATP-binding protein [Clostridiales bacterium]
MKESKTCIQTQNLCKTYYSQEKGVHVIRNLDMEVYKSDFTVIMGASGSGKTTLLYLLSGLDEATSGDVVYDDVKINDMKMKQLVEFRRKKIGYIFQGINLVPYLSLLENVSVIGKLITKNSKEVVEKSKKLLCDFDLEDELHRLPSEVSGGQQQRVAVARAMINDCQILFADEPTGALNTSQGKKMLDIMSEINKDGKSIVMVTHDLKAACRGNRILYLKDGKVHGELSLDAYDEKDLDEREQVVYNFLRKRGW